MPSSNGKLLILTFFFLFIEEHKIEWLIDKLLIVEYDNDYVGFKVREQQRS